MSDNIIQLNEQVIKTELKDLVRQSVEEILNSLLDQEAEELTKASKYERTERRKGYRSGQYMRNLQTTSGNVTLKVPKLKGIPFETAIIERYRRHESSVEEALIEMYLAGVSVRRVEDITKHSGAPKSLRVPLANLIGKHMSILKFGVIAPCIVSSIRMYSSMESTLNAAGVGNSKMQLSLLPLQLTRTVIVRSLVLLRA